MIINIITPNKIPVKLFLILIFLFFTISVFGQVILGNPGFPDFETIVYTQEEDGAIELITYELEYIESSSDSSWLEYRTSSNKQKVLVKLNPESLSSYYSEIWEMRDDSTVHTVNEIVKNHKQVGKDELLITDMYGFLISLRGFPWNERKSAKIVFLNNNSEDFRLEIKNKGQETVIINNQYYDCWKIQIDLEGILGRFFPKSYYWLSVESPHYMVRAEQSGMPGSPKSILEIKSYSGR